MQIATESIDVRSMHQRLERLKAGVASVVAAETGLLKTKAERFSALRRESQRHAEGDSGKLDQRIHSLTADYKEQVAGAHVSWPRARPASSKPITRARRRTPAGSRR